MASDTSMTDLSKLAAGLSEGGQCRVEVVRDMDVPKGAWPWIDAVGLAATGPHVRLETPRDAETIVLWHNEKPAAIVLNIRDQFNHSVQFRFDLRTHLEGQK